MTADTIHVKMQIEEVVRAPIAQTLCAEFAEWLDRNGFIIQQKAPELNGLPQMPPDERSYGELAADFVEEWARVVG